MNLNKRVHAKRAAALLLLLAALILAAGATNAFAASGIDKQVISSGGGHGQSTGYQIDGTFGQPIVGLSSSTNYKIEAGVWISAPTVGPGCSYVVGDANNSHSFNGLDVSYGVAYFKGGQPPPYTCECTPGHIWYVAGDVNNSCSYNGLDITFSVGYFKGGPPPHPCADCPPGGFLIPPVPGEVPAPAVQPILVPILNGKSRAGSME